MSPRISRRRFLQYGAAGGAVLFFPTRIPSARAEGSPPLPKFMEPVPLPGAGIVVATPSTDNRYSFTQREIARQLHPYLPPTPLWAYDDGSGLAGQAGSFGMAVLAESDTPVTVSFTHGLPAT